jgi:hypothetical protein
MKINGLKPFLVDIRFISFLMSVNLTHLDQGLAIQALPLTGPWMYGLSYLMSVLCSGL